MIHLFINLYLLEFFLFLINNSSLLSFYYDVQQMEKIIEEFFSISKKK